MQIDNYEKEIIKIKEQKEKVAQPIVIQITPLESKIKEIDEELTKDRQPIVRIVERESLVVKVGEGCH